MRYSTRSDGGLTVGGLGGRFVSLKKHAESLELKTSTYFIKAKIPISSADERRPGWVAGREGIHLSDPSELRVDVAP